MLVYQLFAICLCVELAESGGTAAVRFSTYNNLDHMLANGQCCESAAISNCPAHQCDPFFDICINPLSQSTSTKCSYGKTTSQVYADEDYIAFGGTLGSLGNPIKVAFGRWTGGISIKVIAKDHDMAAIPSNDPMGTLLVNLTQSPTPNGQLGISKTQTYTIGHATLKLVYSMKCDVFYYGDCMTYCNPNQYYFCDNTGQKICNTGWKGINCRTKVSQCLSDHCQNGATCQSDATDSDVCICAPGYTGVHCETNTTSVTTTPLPSTQLLTTSKTSSVITKLSLPTTNQQLSSKLSTTWSPSVKATLTTTRGVSIKTTSASTSTTSLDNSPLIVTALVEKIEDGTLRTKYTVPHPVTTDGDLVFDINDIQDSIRQNTMARNLPNVNLRFLSKNRFLEVRVKLMYEPVGKTSTRYLWQVKDIHCKQITAATKTPRSSSGGDIPAAIGASFGAVVAILLASFLIFLLYKRKRKTNKRVDAANQNAESSDTVQKQTDAQMNNESEIRNGGHTEVSNNLEG